MPMKMRSLFFLIVFFLLSAYPALATHTINYYYSYKIVDKTSQGVKMQFDLSVFADCYNGSPSAMMSDLMLGIFDPVSGLKLKEVQLAYQKHTTLQDLSQASGNGCFAEIELSSTFDLNANSADYLFQLNSCCYSTLFTNFRSQISGGVFHEFMVPNNLDSGFVSASLKGNTIYPMKSKTSTLLRFEEDPGDFDSVRYELIPVFTDPLIANATAWFVPDTARQGDTILYYTGYTWDKPLGVQAQYIFSDTGSLLVRRNFNFGFQQIAIKCNYYLDGKAYPGSRYITAVINYQLDPHLIIKGALQDSTKFSIESNISQFDSFQNAQILRSQTKFSNYTSIASIPNGTAFTIDSNVTFGQGYYYQLIGINAIDTFYSDTIYLESKSLQQSVQLQLLGATENMVRLNWSRDNLPYYTYYKLKRATDSLGPYQELKQLSDTFYTDSSVVSGTNYYYQLQAIFGTAQLESRLKVKTPGWPLGFEESEQLVIRVYPNPAKDQLMLDLRNDGPLQIINLQGKILISGKMSTGINQINISSLKPGVYFIHTKSNYYRFIKQE